MQKSLLSAEDIFAMKKDGECAIVIKGTDPLYETKCRMENTTFVKLLCRKHNPYDPVKKRHEREIQKSKEKTLFATNETAVMKVQELRENGAEIIRITEKEVEAIARAFKSGQKLTSMKLTEERINENYQKYQTTQALDRTLNLSVYLEGLDDSSESKQIAQARGICAQTLRTAGYSFLQINLLHPFIMKNKSADEIMKIFSRDATREEIENLSKIFG